MSTSISHNPYQTLGISKDADFPRIKKAYHALAIKNHPDRYPELEHRDEFQKIKEAYEVLQDPTRRERYDRQVRLQETRQTTPTTWRTIFPSKLQNQGSSRKPPAEVARLNTRPNAMRRSNSPGFRGRGSTHYNSRSRTVARGRLRRESVSQNVSMAFIRVSEPDTNFWFDSEFCSDSDSDFDSSSDSDSGVAARESRKQVQEGM